VVQRVALFWSLPWVMPLKRAMRTCVQMCAIGAPVSSGNARLPHDRNLLTEHVQHVRRLIEHCGGPADRSSRLGTHPDRGHVTLVTVCRHCVFSLSLFFLIKRI